MGVGRALRRLVQLRAPTQRHRVRRPGRASPRARCPCPAGPPRRVRGRATTAPSSMESPSPALERARRGVPQPARPTDQRSGGGGAPHRSASDDEHGAGARHEDRDLRRPLGTTPNRRFQDELSAATILTLTEGASMLDLRPTCEHCNRGLPPKSTEAKIVASSAPFADPASRTYWATFAELRRRFFVASDQALAKSERRQLPRSVPGEHQGQASPC